MKSLEILKLTGCYFPITLELYNLKNLVLSYCKNIPFGEKGIWKLKYLNLLNVFIEEPTSPIIFPELEKFKIYLVEDDRFKGEIKPTSPIIFPEQVKFI